MTDLEKVQHEAIMNTRDMLTAGRKLTTLEFMEVMDNLRYCIKRYENTFYGCSTGVHSGPCKCQGDRRGPRVRG